MLFNCFNLVDLFSKGDSIRLKNLTFISSISICSLNNVHAKTMYHLKWRYSKYSQKDLHIISVSKNEKVIGYAFLKFDKKKSIKF